MDNLPEAPEGYRYKIVLVKKGLTEAQKRAMAKYEAKKKEERNAKRAAKLKERYNTDEAYRTKQQTNCRNTAKHKKLMAELPDIVD